MATFFTGLSAAYGVDRGENVRPLWHGPPLPARSGRAAEPQRGFPLNRGAGPPRLLIHTPGSGVALVGQAVPDGSAARRGPVRHSPTCKNEAPSAAACMREGGPRRAV